MLIRKYIINIVIGFVFALFGAVVLPVLPDAKIVFFVLALLFVISLSLRIGAKKVNAQLVVRNLPTLQYAFAISLGVLVGLLWLSKLTADYYNLASDRFDWTQHIGEPLRVSAKITDVKYSEYVVRVEADVIDVEGVGEISPTRVSISFDNTQQRYYPSQTIQALVKFKPAYGQHNPFTYNRQKSLFTRQIQLTGTVVSGTRVTLTEFGSSLHFNVIWYLKSLALPDSKWLHALLAGDRSQLNNTDWKLLRETGTGHLFSISGLHLGIVVGGCYLSFMLLLVGFRRLLSILGTKHLLVPSHNLHLWLFLPVMGAASVYAALANWQLPVTRGLILLAILSVLSRQSYVWAPRHIAIIMLAMTLIAFPFSMLSASFFLSAGAVLIIWLLLWRFKFKAALLSEKILSVVLLQIGISILITPLSMIWFDYMAWYAPLINLIIIPIVTVIVYAGIIGLLLSMLVPSMGAAILYEANELLLNTVGYLQKMSEKALLGMVTDTSIVFNLLLIILALVFFLPGFAALRWWLISLCGGYLLLSVIPTNEKLWRLHVFDVGHASAIALTRGSKAILFDTGKITYAGDSDMQNTILPALKGMDITSIEAVFVSHQDNDHAGGVTPLAKMHADYGIEFSGPVYDPERGCVQYDNTSLLGLNIRVLWQAPFGNISSNDQSCVFLVSDGKNSVLFPGDISKSVEYRMLYEQLVSSVDIVVVPHHGSDTSSSGAFLHALSASYAIVSNAFGNRWRFPSQPVMQRLKRYNIDTYLTSEHGYIRFTIDANTGITIDSLRSGNHQRWFNASRSHDGKRIQL